MSRTAELRRQLLLAAVVLVVGIVAFSEVGFGFMSAESLLTGLVIIGGHGYFFSILIIRLVKKQWAAAQGYAICLVALVAGGRISGRLQDHHAEESKEMAQLILLAVEQYRHDTGSFPDALKDLTPQYLDSIAVAPVAFFRERPYQYSLSDHGTHYYISFPAPGGYMHSYSSERRTWRMHD